ncbi:MAG: D-inositol-3-phosphate glycosyltransferase [Gemmatimonadaceae bacterium]|nr:D-inositol-3-phosphate glycosyltransferase [Gemmatimonadaceae bacterium]
MSTLRFCMLTTFYPPHSFGGDAIGIQRLSRALVRRGHHVTVVHDTDAYAVLHRGPSPEVPDHDDDQGVEVRRLHSSAPMVSTLLTQQLGRPVVNRKRIAGLLADGRYDVVNFHNVSLIGGPGLFQLAGEAVSLYMAHEHWLVCPMHVLWRHRRERCTGRECIRCALAYRRPPQLWRATGYLEHELQHVDAIIAMSEFSRDKHAEFGLRRSMEVLPYFLPDPESEITPVPVGASPRERPYFFFAGRLEKIKGLDDVIPIFRSYRDADLVIAGDGEHGGALRVLANGMPNVVFLGRIPPDALGQYYQHAVASLVPSVCFETFGIVLIEAFRQGTPVLARRLGPFPEIVEQSGGGELFWTPEELVVSMRRLQQDSDYRRQLSTAGYRAYVERWTERAVVPRYLDIVRRAAERRGQTRVLEALATQEVA